MFKKTFNYKSKKDNGFLFKIKLEYFKKDLLTYLKIRLFFLLFYYI